MGLYEAYCSKNGIVKTLREYESKNNITPENSELHSSSFLPETYLLDYSKKYMSSEEKLFLMCENQDTWLLKTCHGCQGKGVDLVVNLQQFKEEFKVVKQAVNEEEQVEFKYPGETHVIQRHIEPCLLDGCKFDIRAFVLVACVKPLLVLYHPGYCRRSLVPYTDPKDNSEFSKFQHLTNQAYQKNHPDWEKIKENSIWSIMKAENYWLNQGKTTKELNNAQKKIKKIVRYIIYAGKSQMSTKPGQFELLGIDILFDKNFNPYILEFNSNPSLLIDTRLQNIIKPAVTNNALKIVLKLNMEKSNIRRILKHKLIDYYPFTELINEAVEEFSEKKKIKQSQKDLLQQQQQLNDEDAERNPRPKTEQLQKRGQQSLSQNKFDQKSVTKLITGDQNILEINMTQDVKLNSRKAKVDLQLLEKKYAPTTKIEYEILKLDQEIQSLKKNQEPQKETQHLRAREIEIKMELKNQKIEQAEQIKKLRESKIEENDNEYNEDEKQENGNEIERITKKQKNQDYNHQDNDSTTTGGSTNSRFTKKKLQNALNNNKDPNINYSELENNNNITRRKSVRQQSSSKQNKLDSRKDYQQGNNNDDQEELQENEQIELQNNNKRTSPKIRINKKKVRIADKSSDISENINFQKNAEQDSDNEEIKNIYQNNINIINMQQKIIQQKLQLDQKITNNNNRKEYTLVLRQDNNNNENEEQSPDRKQIKKNNFIIDPEKIKEKLFNLILQKKETLIKQFILNEKNEGEPFISPKQFLSVIQMQFEKNFNAEEYQHIMKNFIHVNLQGLINYRYFLGLADKNLYSKNLFQSIIIIKQTVDQNESLYLEQAKILTQDAFSKIAKVIKSENIDIKKAFKSFDLEKNGFISANSLLKSFKMMNFDYELSEIDAIFYYVDQDRDYKISFKEFKKSLSEIITQQEQQQPKADPAIMLAQEIFQRINEVLRHEGIDVELAFKSIDIDRDNKISVKDLVSSFKMMNLNYNIDDIKKIMKILDKDNDGYLNQIEFQDALCL